jgi:hypothetical protein
VVFPVANPSMSDHGMCAHTVECVDETVGFLTFSSHSLLMSHGYRFPSTKMPKTKDTNTTAQAQSQYLYTWHATYTYEWLGEQPF